MRSDGISATRDFGLCTSINVGHHASAGYKAMLRFDLSELAGVVQSAWLWLYLSYQDSSNTRSVGIHRSLVEWFEGTKCGNTPSTAIDVSIHNYRIARTTTAWLGGPGGGADLDYVDEAIDSVGVSGIGWKSWDLTGEVQRIVDGGENLGWWLKVSPVVSPSQKNFRSRDYSDPAYWPKLLVKMG